MNITRKIINNKTLEIIKDNITQQNTDVIVNAANSELVLGGGVAGAIRKDGGEEIQQECNIIGSTFVGGAVLTTGGNLKAKYVIHSVGPISGTENEDEKLKNATFNALTLCDEPYGNYGISPKNKKATPNALILYEKYKIKTITFPAISTGIFGFPIDRCAKIMLKTVIDYLKTKTMLEKVVFCLYSDDAHKIFTDELKKLFN